MMIARLLCQLLGKTHGQLVASHARAEASTAWCEQTIMIADGRHMFLPNCNFMAHYLAGVVILDKQDVIPYSFQLAGKSYAYWIKCKDETSFIQLFSLLSTICKPMDDVFDTAN
jgi:hypothetical protein